MAETSTANQLADGKPEFSELPVTPEGITASWLSSVLGVKIKSIEITKIIWGTASKALVTVTYDDDGDDDGDGAKDARQAVGRPTHICIKGTFDPFFVQQAPFIIAMYQREVDFFNLLAPALDHIELPRVLWAGHTPQQGIVIMEDLAVRGLVFCDTRQDWPVARVLEGVEQLAALHAKTWGAEPADYPWATSSYEVALLALVQHYGAIIHSPGRVAVPESLQSQARVEAAMRKAYRCQNPKFRCIVHGDAHIGNTYLGEGGRPRFVDFQLAMIWSAFHDVSYFASGALSVADRRAHEWEIVDHYLATLHKLGGPSFSSQDEEVRTEYRMSMIVGVGWLVCPTSFQSLDMINPMCVRHATALYDHKTLELIESPPEVDKW
ncbi:kinase-like domain-containing protein [Biscogniauxia mediterranea]|nr:kinase-like domain-containing protein [Biscogniauxia mediterranea]